MYIEKASQYFDFLRNRDFPNTRVDLEFIVVLIMCCFATVFLVCTNGLNLSIFCESQQKFNIVLWRLARSHRSFDNSFHRWHILLFVPFLSKKWVFWRIWSPLALLSSVWSNVPCLRVHQYQLWLFLCMYYIMHTISCALRLSHIKSSK